MRLWIKDPLAILADGAERGVVVEGNRIAELVGAGAAPAHPVDQSFDACEHVLLPGLINTHHHFYQTLTRVVRQALDKELFDWLRALYPVWAGLDEEAHALASRVAIAELLLSGCTTSVDHHYVFPKGLEHAIDIQADAVRETGIRAVITRGSMNLSVDDGGLPPKSVVQSADVILADSERVIGRHHQRGEGAMLQVALAPCSPFSVTRELMVETAALARREGVRLHTHLSETAEETRYCEAKMGCRPLAYMEQVGWVSDQVWLAHGIHFNDAEVAQLGRAGVGIAHCPSSNMVLASGTCRVLDLEAAGAPVGLAVDGSASNDVSNMAHELRQALLLQRLALGSARISHRDVLRWATEGSARCLGRTDIGTIAPGKQADLALFKLDELRFSGSDDPLAAVVLCGARRADAVMVAGRWLVEDGELSGVDLARLQARHRAAARRMLAGQGA